MRSCSSSSDGNDAYDIGLILVGTRGGAADAVKPMLSAKTLSK